MRRAERLYQIVLLLSDGRVKTARMLAQALEVTERTLYRDMADLIATGTPIDSEAGVGYRLRPGYRLPPITFSEEELQALLLGARMVQGWGDAALGRAADTAMAKIRNALPGDRRGRTEERLLVPDFHVPPAMVEPLGRLRRATNTRNKVRLAYSDASGQTSQRVVWPLCVIFWGTAWTLGAWCELREGFRTFRLDRMQDSAVLAEIYPLQRGRRLADYLRAAAGCEGG